MLEMDRCMIVYKFCFKFLICSVFLLIIISTILATIVLIH